MKWNELWIIPVGSALFVGSIVLIDKSMKMLAAKSYARDIGR